MRDPDDPLQQVDLFAQETTPFDDLWARAELVPLGELRVRVASIEPLAEAEGTL